MDIPFSSRLPWPAPRNRLAALLAERRAAGLPLIDWSESNPTRAGLRWTGAEVLAPLLKEENLDYRPDPRGLAAPRAALATRYAARGLAVGEEGLFLCSSTSEAYGWLFKLLADPGDAVLVPRPGYPLFDYLAGLEAVEARPYRLEYSHPGGWRIDLESVAAGMARGRVRALVLINPNNPTGSYVGSREREALVGLCARQGVALIADEVFFDFPLEDGGGSSLAGESGVLTFVLDGLSKLLGLPQLKLGWIAASGPPGPLGEALGRLEILADSYLSAGTPVMNALPELLALAPAFAARLRGRLRTNLATLRAGLEGPDSPHRVLTCGGGWTALIESPRLLGDEESAVSLLEEEGLYLHPGWFFDLERGGCFAASLLPPEELVAEAVRRYGSWFARRL